MSSTDPNRTTMRALVEEGVLEVVPLKNLDSQLGHLRPGLRVSVTCSPVKGIAATLALAEQLMANGVEVIPHLAARMVESVGQATELAGWLRERAVKDVFVIAGDAPEPHGPFEGALPFLRELLAADPGVARVGVAAYPDGHSLIDSATTHEVLHAKQALLAAAGVEGYAATQMCFDAKRILAWLEAERAQGFSLPVQLGVPGAVDRTRLLTMGARLGIGASLRYLRKNKDSMGRLLSHGGYDPMSLVGVVGPHAQRLGIAGLHVFTFNSVDDTLAWRDRALSDLS